ASCTQKRRPQPRVSTFRATRRRRTPPTPLRAETTTLRPSSIRTVPSAPASHRICFAEKRRRSRAWRVTRHTAGRESHPALKVALLEYQRELARRAYHATLAALASRQSVRYASPFCQGASIQSEPYQ